MEQDDHPPQLTGPFHGGRAGPTDDDGQVDDDRTGTDSSRPVPLGWDGRASARGDLAWQALDRVRDFAESRVVRVAAVAVGLVAVLGWWFVAGAAPGKQGSTSGPFTAGGTTIPFATASTSGAGTEGSTEVDGVADADVVVHAAGAVASPGVYRLPAGSRVSDLIVAAGGLSNDADGDRLNLAEPLVDGGRVYVRHVGEAETPSIEGVDGLVGSGGVPSASGSGGGAGESAAGPIDINRATLDELDELPGVGPATAQAIVSHREQNGPFGSVDELLEVRGIGPAKLEQIRPLVVV